MDIVTSILYILSTVSMAFLNRHREYLDHPTSQVALGQATQTTRFDAPFIDHIHIPIYGMIRHLWMLYTIYRHYTTITYPDIKYILMLSPLLIA